jgi:hypothetical protein
MSIRSLLNSKAPGTDGIVSEVLKNGGPKMEECLYVLCGRVFWQGGVPMDWLRGVVVPLYKDGSKKEPLNYRPVTLLSIVGKVYTGILQARLMDWSEKNNIIEIEQGGFRPGRGYPEQLFTLTELIKPRRLRRQFAYAVSTLGAKVRLHEFAAESHRTATRVRRRLQIARYIAPVMPASNRHATASRATRTAAHVRIAHFSQPNSHRSRRMNRMH